MTDRFSTVTEKVQGIQHNSVQSNEERARNLFASLESLLGSTSWFFGLERPTALDAHAIVLIERLRDVGRIRLVPTKLLDYAEIAFKAFPFESVTEGRRTMLSNL